MKSKSDNDGRRVHRVEKEIQAVVGMYLIHGYSQPMEAFVSVSKVVMPLDLRSARVFVTMMPKPKYEEITDEVRQNHIADSSNETFEEIIELLNEYAFEFQRKISTELKLRYIPKLRFILDEGVYNAIKVDKILNEISKDGPSKAEPTKTEKIENKSFLEDSDENEE